MFKILYTPNSTGKPHYYLDTICKGGYIFTSGISAHNICDVLNADLKDSVGMFGGQYSVVTA